MIIRAEASQSRQCSPTQPLALADIVIGIVPDNIFFALTSGNKLAVLFFAILFGVSARIGQPGPLRAGDLLFEVFYETFIRIIEWLMYALRSGSSASPIRRCPPSASTCCWR